MSVPSTTAAVDEPLYGATPVQAVQRFFRRYVVFSGRASRSEFWWTYLFVLVVVVVLGTIGALLGAVTATPADRELGQSGGAVAFAPITILLFVLAILVPGIALVVRRLHDAGMSGLLALLWLIPSIGGLVILILCILPSQPAGRRFDRDAQQWSPYGPPQPYGQFGASPYGQPVPPPGQQVTSAHGQPAGPDTVPARPAPEQREDLPGHAVRPVPVDPGAASVDEVERAVRALRDGGRDDVAQLADRMKATLARKDETDLLIVSDGYVAVHYTSDGRVDRVGGDG